MLSEINLNIVQQQKMYDMNVSHLFISLQLPIKNHCPEMLILFSLVKFIAKCTKVQ